MTVAKCSSLSLFTLFSPFFVLSVFVPSVLPLRPEPVKLNLVSVTEEKILAKTIGTEYRS